MNDTMIMDYKNLSMNLWKCYTAYFGDVVEPSNDVSTNRAWVDQTNGWERASPEDVGEDAGDNGMAAEQTRGTTHIAYIVCTAWIYAYIYARIFSCEFKAEVIFWSPFLVYIEIRHYNNVSHSNKIVYWRIGNLIPPPPLARSKFRIIKQCLNNIL